MAANTSPVFTLTPNIGKATVGASANTKSDGAGTVGTDIMLVWSAGTNGSYLSRVRFSPWASAAATATSATTLRLFLSTQSSGSTTSSNTWLLQEIAAAAQTADQTTAAIFPLQVEFGFAVQNGLYLLASSHIVNAANTGWAALAFGGDY